MSLPYQLHVDMAMTHKRESLQSVLKEHHEFQTVPQYVARGDYLSFYFVDEPAYSERVDEVLTVYRSQATNDLVGFKIKGVSILAENVVNIFDLTDGIVELRLLFLNAVGLKGHRKHYYALSEKCGTVTLEVSEILRRAA
jgi:hypothetical protein